MAKNRSPIVFIAISLVLSLITFYACRWISMKYTKLRSKRRYDQRISIESDRQKAWVKNPSGPLQNISTSELRKWVSVWHDGIPDKFTSCGDLIQGVRPNGNKARLAYEELIKRNDQNAILPFARLMEFGVPNDTSVINRQIALDLYTRYYANLTNQYERYDALEAVKRLSPPNIENDISHLQSNIAGQILAQNRANRRISHRRKTNLINLAPTALEIFTERPPDGQHEEQWFVAQQLPIQTNRPVNATEIQNIRDDRQNVHDSTVTKTVQTSVERLRDSSNKSSSPTSLLDIRAMLRDSNISEAKRDSANLALDTIERNDQLHSATGMTEMELLHLVWDRVHHHDNQKNQKALRENLANELSACVENGATVCSTGRFTHILNSLNGVDDMVDIKPDWALSRELLHRAGVVYQDRYASLSPDDQIAVDELYPNPEQETKSGQFIEGVQKDIRDEFRQTYVIPGIMSQEKLDVELNKWIDHLG